MICCKSLQQREVALTGQLFSVCDLPIGDKFVLGESFGIIVVYRDCWKITVRVGPIW